MLPDRTPAPGVLAACMAVLAVITTQAMRAHAPLPPPWLWFVLTAACAASPLLSRATSRRLGPFLLLSMYFLMIGWTTAKAILPAHDHLARLIAHGTRIIEVEGVALTEARRPVNADLGALRAFDHRAPRTRFTLLVRTLIVADDGATPTTSIERSIPARGRLWTFINEEDAHRITPGAMLRITGQADPTEPPLNPGARDWRPHSLQQGFAGYLDVPDGTLIRKYAEPSRTDRLIALFYRLRGDARARSSRVLLDGADVSPGRAMLAALLLGEREQSLHSVHVSFTRLGLTHLLAISGLNLVVLAGAFALLLRVLFALLPIPLSIAWRAEPIIISLVVTAYLFILPVQPSILRAGIMTLALLIPSVIGRRHDRVNTLGWTLLLILIWQPYELFSLGLQLSFGVVLALLTLTNPLRDRLFGAPGDPALLSPAQRAWRSFQTALVGAAVAWLVSIPAIAHHTGIISPLAVPATLLGGPAATALSVGGYVTLIISLFSPSAAHLLIPWITQAANLLARAASFADDVPFALIRVPHVSVWLASAATASIVWWLITPRDALSGFPRRVRLARLCVTALIVGWTAYELRTPTLERNVALRVDALYVRDGSCLLLRAGNAAALWDAGGSRFDLGVRTLPDALRALRARNVRDVFLTHANLDHFNAVPDLFGALPIERLHTTSHVLHEAETDPDGPEAALLTSARRHNVEVITHVAGDIIPLGPARLRILWPPADLPLDTPDNDASLVARVEHPALPSRSAALLTGDIQAPAMRALLEQPDDLIAHILEIPHHGSAASLPTAMRFVEAVRPSIILQSTDADRLDDDRWSDARKPGVRWLTTCREGASWGAILRDGNARSGALHPP
ncbi:MAG: ComEC/Rec2 family competence protein [Phycisphaerales bacterium]